MAVGNADERLRVTFRVDPTDYAAELKRGRIVHEGFHAALQQELRVGHRYTVQTPGGTEVFAHNVLCDLADHLGTATLISTATPIPETPGPWRSVGSTTSRSPSPTGQAPS